MDIELIKVYGSFAPDDSYCHDGRGTFKPSGKDSRAYLWICPSLSTVAARVTDIQVVFAHDFLEIPIKMTAEWAAKVVEKIVQTGR